MTPAMKQSPAPVVSTMSDVSTGHEDARTYLTGLAILIGKVQQRVVYRDAHGGKHRLFQTLILIGTHLNYDVYFNTV